MEPNDQQNQSQPQLIKPEQMFTPSVPYQQPQPPAPPQPTVTPGMQPPSEEPQFPVDDDSKKRKILILIIGGLVGIFVIVIIIVLLTSSGSKKNNQGQNDQSGQGSGIFPAPSALDIQNGNNSITSDITSLNDDSDFPAANLSDTSLRL